MNNETICDCGRPTRNAAYSCDDCGDALARALGEVPWLDDELETSTTRQQGIDYRRVGGGKGGKRDAERPSPVSWGPSEARAHLKALLVSWSLYCSAEGVRNSSPYDGMPEDNLPSLSRWLMWRVDGLLLHDIAPEAVDEITSAVAHCHRLIDRPADRQYLGDCEQPDCSGRMHVRAGGEVARCDTCDTPVPADQIRTRLLAQLDDRLCTAAEIARLSTYLGLKADREQVRKRINQWAKRKVITEHKGVTTEVTFQFGEVYAKLIKDEYAVRKVG